MLRNVKITKLFNKENIEIDFSKRSVIITGDNGNGKTTILNIIYNILVGRYLIANVNFESVSINFKSDFRFMNRIDVKREITESGESINVIYNYKNEYLKVIFRVFNIQKSVLLDRVIETIQGKETILYQENSRDNQVINLKKDISIIDILNSIEENKFIDRLKKINESLLYFPTYRRIDIDIESYYASFFDTPLLNILRHDQDNKKKKFGINDRRVIGMSNSDIEDILKEYTRSLNEVSSNNLDILLRDFTKNTMLEMNKPATDIKMPNLGKNTIILKELEKINSSLNLEISKEILEQISQQYEENVNFLDNLRRNANEKGKENKLVEVMLAVPLMQVLQKLQESYSKYNNTMTEEMANYKYISENLLDFSGKKLNLIKTELNEFKFQKIGTEIDKFSDFSTGEKQLITFLVYSAIELPNDVPALIIIDEPELSLHVKWQNKLLRNILKKENIQVLSATHSPYIINKKEVDSLVIRKVDA